MKKDFDVLQGGGIDELVDGYSESLINLSDEGNDNVTDIIKDIPESLFNLSDEAINNSLDTLVQKPKRGRAKKSATLETEEIVNAYINNRTDKNWKALQERFWYGIKKHAYQFVKNWDVSEDLTIETFMKAHQAIDSFDRSKGGFSTWLWTICTNNSLLYLKNESRIKYVDTDISDVYDSTMMAPSKASVGPNEQFILSDTGDVQVLNNTEILQKIYDTSVMELNNLGGNTSKILNMKLVENMKIREISKILNMNESTVKNYLYKGEKDLATIMKTKHKELYEMYQDALADQNEHEINLEFYDDIF